MGNAAPFNRWKGLVLDDELREIAVKVREKLALVGNHKVAPMYLLAIRCLESGLFYEDSEQLRARLKAEMRDAVGMLDDILAREGTEREREERRAEAIAKDRREIMASIRDWPANAMSFATLPMRWFDDWTRVSKPLLEPGGFRWESGKRADPLEDLCQILAQPPAQEDRFVSRAQYENLKRCEKMLGWPEAQPRNRTPAEQEAYIRSFQGHWLDPLPKKRAKYTREWLAQRTPDELRALYEQEFGRTPEGDFAYWREGLLTVMPCECPFPNPYDCRATRDGTERRLYRCHCSCHKTPKTERDKMHESLRTNWAEGTIRFPSAKEKQTFLDELVEFTRTDFDKVARRHQIDGAFNVRTPQETEALRAWATYLLKTELFDRSGPHVMLDGEAIPREPHGHIARRHAAQAQEATEATCRRLVGAETSARLRREVNEHVRHAMRNGGDVAMALERYLEQLPSPLTEEELHKLMQP